MIALFSWTMIILLEVCLGKFPICLDIEHSTVWYAIVTFFQCNSTMLKMETIHKSCDSIHDVHENNFGNLYNPTRSFFSTTLIQFATLPLSCTALRPAHNEKSVEDYRIKNTRNTIQ